MKIRIICDDFTSATDGLAGFASCGWSTAVTLGDSRRPAASVLSADTDSRTLNPLQAAERVYRQAALWSGADLLIKQFDSTLRGPVVQEILAARAGSHRRKVIVVPAFPEAGRTTKDGCVYVNGRPLHETEYARDPLNPVFTGSLPQLFEACGQTVAIAKDALHAGRLLKANDIVVVDAGAASELVDIATTHVNDARLLWAGSTGLLRAMSQAVKPPARAPARLAAPSVAPCVVVGSRNPSSRAQVAELQKSRTVQVFSSPDETGPSGRITGELAAKVREATLQGKCDSFVITGGETAKHVARALGAVGISVLEELEPGIPLCILHTPMKDFPMITKAGGFGTRDVLVRCIDVLMGRSA